MAGAVFFLLLGMLFSEIAMLGLDWAGVVGAALLTMSATVLVHIGFAQLEARKAAATHESRRTSRRTVTA